MHKRVHACKRLRVSELTSPNSLADHLADRARQLGSTKHPARILVYCDRRRDAVKVKSLLDKVRTGHASQLLVGARRVYERASLEGWLAERGFLGRASDPPDVPTFLVATSAGEVGVDLNTDHMVCDLVSWERMVQRLGRVNRRGENRSTIVDVFAVRPTVKVNARKATREKAQVALKTFDAHLAPLRRLTCGPDGRCDASPAALASLKKEHREVVDAATTEAPLYPRLTRPLLDSWSMTSLRRHEARPEVAPWLRGWDRDEPQTSVVWRKHLPCLRSDSEVTVNSEIVTKFFGAAPIHVTERLETKSTSVMDWLLKRSARLANRSDDHELAVDRSDIVAILLDRAGEYLETGRLSELRSLAAPTKNLSKREKGWRDRRKKEWTYQLLPGATLVVDSRLCGLQDGMLDDKYESQTASADADEAWRTEVADSAAEPPTPVITFRVEEVAASADAEALPVPHLRSWRHLQTFDTRLGPSGTAQGGLAVYRSVFAPTSEDSLSVAATPQSLGDHADQVMNRARTLAQRLNLPDKEVEAIGIAARLHDDGKAAALWQDAMNAPPRGRPYAKTAGGCNWRLLEGYRHEFGSLLRAERKNLPDDLRDLVLHLIAAHHGRARPLIRSEGCEDGPPSVLESKAGEVAVRFARLQRRYGPWGLAYREAILRAADQWESRAVHQSSRSGGDG